MIRFTSFRAKDPVIAALVSFGLIFGAPSMTMAQHGTGQAGWEEVGPAANAASARQQLRAAPPRVVAAPLGNSGYRPPVAPPGRNTKQEASESQSVYTVQAGDTLPKIAMKIYGDPNKWQDLMVLNNIENGNRIFVGQRLHVSAPNSNVANVADANDNNDDDYVPEHEIAETPAPSVSADAIEADASFYGQTGGTYTIQRGDTLGKIAKRILGSSRRWREIARANPSINANRLNVGEALVIPGAQPVAQEMSPPMMAQPAYQPTYQQAQELYNPTSPQVRMTAPTQMAMSPVPGARATSVSEPSFDPPPLMPPPPPSMGNVYSAPSTPNYSNNSAPTPPPAPQVYSSGGMTPPPPPPVSVPSSMPSPNVPPAPYMSAPVGPAPVPAVPIAIGSRELYREERYRIPDELKPTDFSPYFANSNGYHGLFQVESALIPYIPTWNFGFTMKYRKYQYLNGDKDLIEGNETYMPLSLTYAGKKMFIGLTIPFQNWEVGRPGGTTSVSVSGLHDPKLNIGYQIWKNLEGTHGVTLHAEGRFPGDNYSQPIANMSGKSRDGVRIGPAEATRGAWVEIGGAYTGQVSEKWASHLNLALANDSTDSITKYILRGGMDYRVNHNFSLVGEVNSSSYVMDNGPEGTNMDLVLGALFFNDNWQGRIGFPIAIQKDWGYGHDYGVEFSLTHRWD